jgi:hypothetical protein
VRVTILQLTDTTREGDQHLALHARDSLQQWPEAAPVNDQKGAWFFGDGGSTPILPIKKRHFPYKFSWSQMSENLTVSLNTHLSIDHQKELLPSITLPHEYLSGLTVQFVRQPRHVIKISPAQVLEKRHPCQHVNLI